MQFRALALILFALLLQPSLAAGQAPEDVRWVDRTGASSQCLGAPKSAECAVETAVACRVRRDISLCRAVGMDLPPEAELPFSLFPPDPFAVVEVTGVKYLLRDDGAGDNRRIGVSIRLYGKYGLNWPDSSWRRGIYEVRRDGTAWRVERVLWQPWVRRIGPRDASSNCIGEGDVPLCAVQTHIACRVRADESLCTGLAGLEPKHFRPKGATVLYIVDRIRRWEPEHSQLHGETQLVVWVAESTELPRPDAGESSGPYVTRPEFRTVSYILEHRGGRWSVVSRTERP